jgi:alpha-tubulin suppressor-like RCC1 family protein
MPVGEVMGATKIMAGGFHACALSNAGLQCWGGSYAGQVGVDDYFRTAVPVTVSIAGTVAALAGGANHTCALLDGGRVTCWGEDRTGQLGDGSFDTHAPVVTELPCP